MYIFKYGEDVPRYPRPTYDEVKLQMPLLHLDKESGRYEERFVQFICSLFIPTL